MAVLKFYDSDFGTIYIGSAELKVQEAVEEIKKDRERNPGDRNLIVFIGESDVNEFKEDSLRVIHLTQSQERKG